MNTAQHVYERSRHVVRRKMISWKRAQLTGRLESFDVPYKLHLGCGPVRFDGWIHVDANPDLADLDIVWDLDNGIPVPASSCQFVYSEHFIEHLSVQQGLAHLRECHRILQPGGVVRIATPSLDSMLTKCVEGTWQDQDWLTWPPYRHIASRAEMLNIVFRSWGHQWLYDRAELHRRFREAGFEMLRDVDWGQSTIEQLRGREWRQDSLLICEAQK